jgi:hypothetical protein
MILTKTITIMKLTVENEVQEHIRPLDVDFSNLKNEQLFGLIDNLDVNLLADEIEYTDNSIRIFNKLMQTDFQVIYTDSNDCVHDNHLLEKFIFELKRCQ